MRLALLEGSRLEKLGDMEGARGWYRAVLRNIYHIGLHGTVFRRSIAQDWHDVLRDRVTTWAADPRMPSAVGRRPIQGEVMQGDGLAAFIQWTKLDAYATADRVADVNRSSGYPATDRQCGWNLSPG
jgi:hypothetical protein